MGDELGSDEESIFPEHSELEFEPSQPLFRSESVSSWTVCAPTPKSLARPGWVNVITNERDVQEHRWRLARRLYSQVKNPLLLLPWERTCKEPLHKQLWPAMTKGECLEEESDKETETEPLLKRPRMTFSVKAVKNLKWETHEDLLRQKSLVRWRIILEENLLASNVGRELHSTYSNPDCDMELELSLKDIFFKKSTATIAKRASSLCAYISWAHKNKVEVPTSVTENKIYKYLCFLKESGASPTAARAFLESLNFAKHTIGLLNVDSCMSSRVKGSASTQWAAKRPLKQSVPLTINDVWKLEQIVLNSKDKYSRIAAGHFLFCIYACCRFRDSQRLYDFTVDMAECGLFGLIESRTLSHKLANSDERRTTFLPMVSLAWGISAKPWGEIWIGLMEQEGLVGKNFVLPAPLRSGGWSRRPLTTGEASMWLRDLLVAAGSIASNGGVSYTAHGLKTTGLSWSAKSGMSIEDRLVLGHHMDKKGVSALTYSRDALAGPLAAFAAIVAKIRWGEFNPDLSRAQRLANGLPQSESSQGAVLEDTNPLEGFENDSSSDSEDMNEELTLSTEKDLADSSIIVRQVSKDILGVYLNSESGLGHLLKESSSSLFRCGRRLNGSYIPASITMKQIHMCLMCSPKEVNKAISLLPNPDS